MLREGVVLVSVTIIGEGSWNREDSAREAQGGEREIGGWIGKKTGSGGELGC